MKKNTVLLFCLMGDSFLCAQESTILGTGVLYQGSSPMYAVKELPTIDFPMSIDDKNDPHNFYENLDRKTHKVRFQLYVSFGTATVIAFWMKYLQMLRIWRFIKFKENGTSYLGKIS